MGRRYIIILIMLTGLYSCGYFSMKGDEGDDSPVIARVGEDELHRSELDKVLRDGMSSQDSALAVNSYIDRWALKKILLQKAKMNLPEQKKYDFDKLVDEYRADLYINYYKQALIGQYFDSVFTPEEITQYYNKHKNMFKSSEAYVQYKLVVYQEGGFKKGEIRKHFTGNTEEDINFLMENAVNFNDLQLNDSIWVPWKALVKKHPPLSRINLENIVSDVISVKKNGKIYLLQFNNMLFPGEIKPIKFVEDEIKKMMIHRKKIEFLKETQTRLIQEAIQNNQYEKFN